MPSDYIHEAVPEEEVILFKYLIDKSGAALQTTGGLPEDLNVMIQTSHDILDVFFKREDKLIEKVVSYFYGAMVLSRSCTSLWLYASVTFCWLYLCLTAWSLQPYTTLNCL